MSVERRATEQASRPIQNRNTHTNYMTLDSLLSIQQKGGAGCAATSFRVSGE